MKGIPQWSTEHQLCYIQHCKAEAWDRATGLSPIPPIALVHVIYNQLMSRDDADAQSRSQYFFFLFWAEIEVEVDYYSVGAKQYSVQVRSRYVY